MNGGGGRMGEDFPMVCESCLGDNRFVRMVKLPAHAECRITGRPFTVFRWRSKHGRGCKETIVCYEIAAEKNICQSCLNDLDCNVPLALRDAFENAVNKLDPLAAADEKNVPTSEKSQIFFHKQELALHKKKEAEGQGSSSRSSKLFEMAQRVVETREKEDKNLNLPSLCFSWIKGSCPKSRKGACKFRPCCGAFAFPELRKTRYEEEQRLVLELKRSGPNRTVVFDADLKKTLLDAANEALRVQQEIAMKPPEDLTIRTLYLVGVPEELSNHDLQFSMEKFGQIQTLRRDKASSNAFIQYATREAAEAAMTSMKGRLKLPGISKNLKIGWALKRRRANISDENDHLSSSTSTVRSLKKAKTDQQQGDGELGPQGKGGFIAAPAPIPEILPGIPLPAGFKVGDNLPAMPDGLLNAYKEHARNFKPKELPGKKVGTEHSPVVAMEEMYPSLKHSALEGAISLF